MKLVLGIDVGTSWVKAGLYDRDGRLLASHRVPSGAGKSKLCASDADLQQWWEAVAAAVRPLAAKATPESMAYASRAYYYYLYFDEQMSALSIDEAPQIPVEEVFAAPGWGQGGAWSRAYAPVLVAHLKWLREQYPLAHGRIRRAGTLHDYLLWRLTGEWVTDPCNGPFGLSDWPEAAMSLSGLPREAFATMREPESLAGGLLPAPALNMGLRPGLPVAVSGHDGALANLGGGADRVGDAMITLGTNTVLRIVTGDPVDGWFGYPIPPGNYAWVRGVPGTGPMVTAAKEKGRKAFRVALEQVVAKVQELLAAAHTAGLVPRRFKVTGGLSNVPLMRRLLRDALGAPLYRVDPEAGMRGAAMLAAVAAGWYPDVPAAARGMRYKRPTASSEEGSL